MKVIKKFFCVVFVMLLLISNAFTVNASTQMIEFEYLKSAIAMVDAVPADEINQYIEDNRATCVASCKLTLVFLSIPTDYKVMCGHGCPHKSACAKDGAC